MDKGSKVNSGNAQFEPLTADKLTKMYKRFLAGWQYRSMRIRDDHLHKIEHPSRLERRGASRNEVIAMNSNYIGSLAAWSRTDGSISLFNVTTQRHSFTIKDAHGADKLCLSITWNPVEAHQFVTVGNSTTVKVWNALDSKNPSFKSFVTGPRMKNHKCLFDPFGKWLIVLTKSDEVYLFDVVEGYKLHSISKLVDEGTEENGKIDTARAICWLNDGKHIVVGFKSGHLKILRRSETGFEPINTMVGHLDAVSCLAVDPWGLFFVSGSEDGCCALWSLEDFTCNRIFPGFEGIVESVSVSNDGLVLAVGSRQVSKDVSKLSFMTILGHDSIQEYTFSNNCHSLVMFIPETMKLLITEEQDIVTLFKSGCRSIIHTVDETDTLEANTAANVAVIKRLPTIKDEERKPSKRRRSEKLRSIERKDAGLRMSKGEEISRPVRRIDENFSM